MQALVMQGLRFLENKSFLKDVDVDVQTHTWWFPNQVFPFVVVAIDLLL